jgi:hypothetical protein
VPGRGCFRRRRDKEEGLTTEAQRHREEEEELEPQRSQRTQRQERKEAEHLSGLSVYLFFYLVVFPL